jgi:HSP20 family molecular chaperone IbpA
VVKGDRQLKAGSATETKTFNRELTLPDYVDINKMSASLLDNNAQSEPAAATMPSQVLTSTSSGVSNVLVIEAPVILEKYAYRRSAYDTARSASPNRGARNASTPGYGVGVSINASAAPPPGANHSSSSTSKTTTYNPATGTTTTSQTSHTEKKTQTTSTTHTTSRVVRGSGSDNDYSEHVIINKPLASSPSSGGGGFDDDDINGRFKSNRRSPYSPSGFGYNQSIAPELINGYPIYDRNEGCVVYKFDLSGFDQNEISLTITADRTLEIKASKEQNDNLGKVYKEFKREI